MDGLVRLQRKSQSDPGFLELIPTYWNGKYAYIARKRAGPPSQSIRDQMTFGEVLGADFRIVISREDARTSAHGRECRGFVSLNQVKSGDPYKAQDTYRTARFPGVEF